MERHPKTGGFKIASLQIQALTTEISKTAKEQLEIYKKLLQEFNRKFNLYSRASEDTLLELFFDSLMGAKALKEVLKTIPLPVLDIGSGNGFPGLVCAILYPEISFVLCDRSLKKTEFLKHSAFHLRCHNVTVFCGEVKLLNNNWKRVVSKGAVPIEALLRILEQILAPKGQAFLWKNSDWQSRWPKGIDFSVEEFKAWQTGTRESVLLKVQKNAHVAQG